MNVRRQAWVAAIAAIVVLLGAGCAKGSDPSADGKPLEIGMNVTNPSSEKAPYSGFEVFAESVEELSGGDLTIKNAGGPESIDPFEMGNVIGTGAIDAAFASVAYMLPRIPEAAVLSYSPLTIQEMRDSGAWDKIRDIYAEKMNVHLLGLTLSSLEYNFYTKKPVSSLKELKGLRMRSTPGYQPLLDRLGIEGIQMPSGEIFSGLERGLIDAYPQLAVGSVYPFGTEKFLKYKIGPGWWHGDVVLLLDLDYWESLSQERQELLTEAAIEAEAKQPELLDSLRAEEIKQLEGDGITVTELPEADGKELQRIAADVGADYIRKNVKDKKLATQLVDAFFPGS